MKTTLSYYDFEREFMNIRPHSFSYEALEAIWNYYEELEEETGEEIEFDPIGICCYFTEDDIKSTLENYSLKSLADLEARTHVLKVYDGMVLYLNF